MNEHVRSVYVVMMQDEKSEYYVEMMEMVAMSKTYALYVYIFIYFDGNLNRSYNFRI